MCSSPSLVKNALTTLISKEKCLASCSLRKLGQSARTKTTLPGRGTHPKAAKKRAQTPQDTIVTWYRIYVWQIAGIPLVFMEVSVSMKTHVYKEKRAWLLSHEAFLTLQELARQQGLQTAAFLEIISRELALQRLSEDQRARIKTEAERIANQRKDTP